MRLSLLSPLRLRIAANTTSQLFTRILTSFATVMVTYVIARTYGSEGFGEFTKITTFVAFFYLFVDFGMNAIYLQQHQENTTQPKDLPWQTLFTSRVFISIIYMLTVCVILIFLPTGHSSGYTWMTKIGILLLLPSILTQSIILTSNAVFQQHLRYELATLSALLGAAITIIGVWINTRLYLPEVAILASVVVLVVAGIVSASISLWLIRPYVHVTLSVDRKRLKALVLASLPLGLTLVCNVIYFRADTIILTLTRSTAEVGVYGLAYKIFEFPLAFATFFMNAAYPVMLQRFHSNVQSLEPIGKMLRLSFIFLLSLSFGCIFFLWFLAPLLTYIRPDFTQSIVPLRILSIGLPFFFISSLTMWIMIAQKKQIVLLTLYGLAMIGNILANIYWIPTHGVIAASWITVVSEAFICLVSLLIVRKHLISL